MAKAAKNIILGVTASIAIYKACDLVRLLRKSGFNVCVVMTKEAEELIKPIVFQSLSGNRVYRGGIFEEQETWEIEHISLAGKADLILIAPATANIIAKLACGICDDLLTCTVCATKSKVLIAPAMNENMYKNKITQSNIAKLKSCGYKFIAPTRGLLACGAVGIGCLAETEEIVRQVKNIL
ncbi:MAG: flavoprotein [Candidatus Omnitrophica bacterium]|nr:flavoprotein [Candidatus Omnitrophota bacterium]